MALSVAGIRKFNVRLILAGACQPHAGRQILFEVNVDDHTTLRSVIEDSILPQWPDELGGLRDALSAFSVKVLKDGSLLRMESHFLSSFSEEEISRYTASGCSPGDADEIRIQRAVLIHLVFAAPLENRAAVDDPLPPHHEAPTKVERGCCAVM